MFGKRLAAVGAVALSAILLAPGAVAAPSQDEIDAVRDQAADTRAAVAEVEVELARVGADHDAAEQRVQVAAEQYNAAQESLAEAEEFAQNAQDDLTGALAELEEARALVAEIAMSAYRDGGSFTTLSMMLQADGISAAVSTANTYMIFGDRADTAQQQLDAATIAADLAKEIADDAVAGRQVAVDELNAAHAQTALEAEAAEAEMNRVAAQQDALLNELAALRETTVEMERERREHLDEQRRERESRAAQRELQREQQARPERPSPTEPSPRPTTDAGTQSPSPSPTSTPRPTPSATPAPSPSASPTPTPRPTPTSTPRPTPTPTPTPEPTPTPKPTPPPAPAPSGAGATALAWGKTQIGKPYVWGAAGPHSYDCSGLTLAAFQQAGINLPRNAAAQYGVGSKVPVGQMQAGDLFFYSDNGAQSGIYHVAIYAGNGMRLHAPSPGKTVELVPMWWANVMPYAVRL